MSDAYKTVITVPDVDAKLDEGFTCIEIWASVDQGGTYEEITWAVSSAAKLLSKPPATQYRAGGTKLVFNDSNHEIFTISFSETIPLWTAAMVIERINDEAPGFVTLDPSGAVALQSDFTGRASSLEIVSCSCSDLWTTGQKALGRDVRLYLVQGKYIYPFVDLAGIPDVRYKWRFSNMGANPVSLFSKRVLGDLAENSGVPVAIATAKFVNIDGSYLKRKVIISSNGYPVLIGGATIGNELSMVVESDDKGFLQVPLVKGAQVRVAIEGTAFIKEFQVPQSDVFDLFQAMALAPDQFAVQTVPPLLTRRNI